jgi:nitroimidazol reductase NimA-like FMN-containing flavoprotein (pyridoxamine 5'-phosphate oxidase superfamily)
MTEYQPTKLTTDEAWEMLESQEFGRLAFHLADEVNIMPINYACQDRKRIIFRTAEGSKLLGITMNPDVAFEIDSFSDEDHAASVILRGTARQLEGHEADATDQLPLRPWVDTTKVNVIAIEVEEVSARAFHLTRPWMHLRPHE